MTIFEAIFLGIVQGATEFLPVSSSGHSILLPLIFGMDEPGLTEVIFAHQGTLLAVLIYFRRDLLEIVNAFWRGLVERDLQSDPNSRLGWFILFGSIPVAVAGLLFEQQFGTLFADPRFAALFLLLTAGLLVLGERMFSGRLQLEAMTWRDALFIGCCQILALLPGVSRSGSTIVAGLTRGLTREFAARYSFLMSIPVIGGAGLLGLVDLLQVDNLATLLPSIVTVFITSAIVGYGCIAFLMDWVKQRSLYPFAVYCALLGSGYLAYTVFT